MRMTVRSGSPSSNLHAEEGLGDVQGADGAGGGLDLVRGEEAGFAQDPHAHRVSRVTHGLLHHVRRPGRPEQGAETVGVEGLQGPQAGKVHELDVGEGRTGDLDTVSPLARRPDVLLDDVGGGEGRLVLPGPGALHRKPAHQAMKRRGLVQVGLHAAQDQVAEAGSDAAVEETRHAGLLGELLQPEGVFGEEGDVHDGLAFLEHPLDGPVSHEARDGPHHEVGVPYGLRDSLGLRQVGDHTVGPDLGELLDPYRIEVHHQYVEILFGGEVTHDGASDPASAQHHDVQDDPPFLLLGRARKSDQSGDPVQGGGAATSYGVRRRIERRSYA